MIHHSFVAANGSNLELSSASRDTFKYMYSNGTGYSYSKLGVIITRQMIGAFFTCNAYQPGLEKYYNQTVNQRLNKALCKYM